MTQREREMAKELGRLRRQLQALKPYLCMYVGCTTRESAEICPHCGHIKPNKD